MGFPPFLKILNIIFPPLCVACRKKISDGVLCGDCEKSIETRSGFVCPACSRRLPETENNCHEEEKFILAAASYYNNFAVKELIHALKYQGIKATLEPLTGIVNAYLQKVVSHLSLVISNCVIVPLPLHPKKEKERGFNQAFLISQAILQYLEVRLPKEVGLPKIETGILVRTRKTNPQIKTKSYEERNKNVAGCFKVNNPENIAGKNVILVDDVFTSGATMREAVKVLKQAGAKKIIGFVVAKA